MKKFIVAAVGAAAVLLPAFSQAQNLSPYTQRQVVLAKSLELDGEAADADQVVTVATLADSTTFTVAANPDTCRLVDATVVDGDSSISAGTLTVIGTDCWGDPLKVTFAMTGGSGVRTGTVVAFDSASSVKASGAYFRTVTSVVSGVLTGESGAADTLTVGYTANSGKSWPLYGRRSKTPSGIRFVDVFGNYEVRQLVTNGAAQTDVVAVSASTTAPFENVNVGDLLIFNVNGEVLYRKVASRADADTITVDDSIALPTAGANFSYKKFFLLADPIDGWIGVDGFDVVTFLFQVDKNTDTGGVISSIECGTRTTSGTVTAVDLVFEEDTATVASTATGTDISSIDLRLKPMYNVCRASVKFGTGDDGDASGAAEEDVDIVMGFRQ